MFSNLFINRLKILVRKKEVIFWNLCFPIILATLFNMTLVNINKNEEFKKVDIAVINNQAYQNDKSGFKEFLNAVSDDNNKDGLFNLQIVDEDEAKSLLEDNKIKAYVNVENNIELTVKSSGYEQTITKSFLDYYKQRASTISNVVRLYNGQVNNEKIEQIASESNNYLKNIKVSDNAPNVVVIYFYSVLGMTCMYSATVGSDEIRSIQANLSPEASRISLAPVNKFKLFIYSGLAAFLVQFTLLIILLVYIRFALGIDFGTNFPLIILTSVIGTITGLLFGTCISAMLKISSNAKIGIIISINMVFATLSGMMNDQVKYLVQQNIPILAKINPINLITDAFYSLYYYDTYDRFINNILGLSIMSIIFCIITFVVLRRQQYDSI
jgi:ABC-2 type transport system permease protein